MIVCGCCLPSGKHWCLSPIERGGAVRPMCRACRLLPLLQQTAVAQYSQGLCSYKGHGTQSRERHLCLHGLRPCTAPMSARWWYCSWLSMVDDFLLAIAGEVHCRLYGVWCSRVNVLRRAGGCGASHSHVLYSFISHKPKPSVSKTYTQYYIIYSTGTAPGSMVRRSRRDAAATLMGKIPEGRLAKRRDLRA